MNSVRERLHNDNWAVKISRNKDSKRAPNSANMSVISILPEVSSVLDVGCGRGELMSSLKSKGIDVTGIDISDVALKEAAKNGLMVKKVDLDGRLPFKENSFDCVICVQVLMHVFNPEGLLVEMKRVSNKFVIINVPNHSYWRFRINFLLGNMPDVFSGRAAHIRFFNRKKIIQMISDSELKVIKESYTGKKLFPSVFATGLTFLCKK
ncbi:MAG: methyltransferase domain-containing protein [Candidatus Diapherotrites archaeon]|nr:methyltransferase domain-containing protein [Candidatus Diapherotrites archaeon]